ncbi:SMC1 [Symbiodinium microadriaticum]|nr:SMC1 [Symbiodinium microadriaticum]
MATSLQEINILSKARNFLVFQGDIEAAAHRQGKDLTAFFEQVSGSVALSGEYEKLASEKAAREDTARDLYTRKRDAQHEKKRMAQQKEEAEKYQEMQSEYRAMQTEFILFQLLSSESVAEELSKGIGEARREAEAIEADREAAQQKLVDADQDRLEASQATEDADLLSATANCCWSPVDPNPENLPWCFFSDRKVQSCKIGADPQTPFSDAELQEVVKYFEANLDAEGTGEVMASPDHATGPGGDYYFSWARDGALSMNAYLQSKGSLQEIEAKMDAWISWLEQSQNQPDPNNINILVEPKYTGGWCRPQNDGPGLRSITALAYAELKPSMGSRVWALVKQNLDWVVENYDSETCDLWKEVRSPDFWNRYTMRKALKQGAAFAKSVGTRAGLPSTDSGGSERPDTAVIEVFNVGDMEDGVFALLNKEVVATLSELSQLFCRSYAINQQAASKGLPGATAMTAAAAAHTPPAAEVKALREPTPQNLLEAGDALLLLMVKHLTNGMHMNEQIDRNTGELKSAKDLTWNYSNILKAMAARRAAADLLPRTMTMERLLASARSELEQLSPEQSQIEEEEDEPLIDVDNGTISTELSTRAELDDQRRIRLEGQASELRKKLEGLEAVEGLLTDQLWKGLLDHEVLARMKELPLSPEQMEQFRQAQEAALDGFGRVEYREGLNVEFGDSPVRLQARELEGELRALAKRRAAADRGRREAAAMHGGGSQGVGAVRSSRAWEPGNVWGDTRHESSAAEAAQKKGEVQEIQDITATERQIEMERRLNGHLDAVVTQTVDGARSCVQHLKDGMMAPLTFLPLDNLKSMVMDRRLHEALQGRMKLRPAKALSCISFESPLSRAFDFLLSDVVIADSLDDGREFAQPACLRMTSLAFASEAALLAIALQVFGVLKELGLKCRTPSGSSTIDECPTHPDIRPAASITEPPAPLQGGDTQRGGDLSGFMNDQKELVCGDSCKRIPILSQSPSPAHAAARE